VHDQQAVLAIAGRRSQIKIRIATEIRLLARRPEVPAGINLDPLSPESRLAELLEDIAEEETPERLLKLAIELQQQLMLRKQQKNPN
jgi:hypothetical protein